MNSRKEDQTQTKFNERIRRSESKKKKGLPGGRLPRRYPVPQFNSARRYCGSLWFSFLAFAKFAALLH